MANAWSTAVPCAEEWGTASENYDEQTGMMSAEVTLRCLYVDRHALCADICGNRNPWPKGAAGLVPRASRAGIRMADNQGSSSSLTGLITSLDALVTVYYSTKDEDIITEELEPVTEFVTLDHRWFRWGSGTGDQVTEEEAPGRLVRSVNLVRTQMYFQPPIPMEYITLIGSVNDAEIASDFLNGLTFPTETLLYAPPSISRKINSLGQNRYDIVKKWSYNPNGWNTFYRPKQNQWLKMYVQNSNDPYESYPLEDHSILRA